MGVFGCFEVTIGFYGNERVDYITYDTKEVWRCYEIKVSKKDFYSNAAKTFVGHYNYYVMPEELYKEVKEDIPKHIGVHNGQYCIKNAKRQELAVDENILKDSLIRSLSRENEKFIRACDTDYINRLKRRIARLEKKSENDYNRYLQYSNAIFRMCEVYGLEYAKVKKLVKEVRV